MPDHDGAAAAPVPLLSLDLSEPHRQLLRVSLAFTPRSTHQELRLPGWTPGSYLIRDYVRTLEGLEATQAGRLLTATRLAPATWRLELEHLEPVRVTYRIQASERSVRTCHLSAEHGFLALAGVALQVEGERWSPHQLEVCPPEGWQVFVPLPQNAQGRWLATDFDQLIDSPVEAGPHPCHRFEVAGVPHRWVSWGGDLPASDQALLKDVERVCLACCSLMGMAAPPSASYLFVLHLLDQGYGGLEHDHSCVLQYGRRALRKPEGRRKLLQLVAHEYLHQWNVRRLRPAELTPIDYDRAQVVPSLWFAEGITTYLDQLLPLKAGLSGEADLLEDLGAELSRYLLTPGRRVQSLRQSSQEAWVKLYRQDASSADSQVSYYLKGAVLALILDLHLRRHGSCLALVLRQLWRSHGWIRKGYRETDLIAAFASQAEDLASLLPHWLESTEDPPLADYLSDVGLLLEPQAASQPFLGWQLKRDPAGGLQLRRVWRDGPAQRAGLQIGDELLAIDGQRLRQEDDLELLLAPSADGSVVEGKAVPRELLFCRDGLVRTTILTPDPAAIETWRLSINPLASEACTQRRHRWLSLEP